MTNRDFVNVKLKDRFHKDFTITGGEAIFTFFYTRISAFLGLIWLFNWILQIATR